MERNGAAMAMSLKISKAEPAHEESMASRRRRVEQQQQLKMSEGENLISPESFAKFLAVTLKTPKAEPGSIASPGIKVESVEQLKMPLGEMKTSPKCVLGPDFVNLSSSSAEESSKESDSENSSGASSDDPDLSDSGEEDYEMCEEEEDDDDDDEEDEEGRPPRAKKAKITSDMTTVKRYENLSGTQVKRKCRVKITAMRPDSRLIKPRNSNPGRRRVGKRIYDSVLGKTCHWCRQKTVELHVECASCPIRFCGACLQNRNGEDVELEMLVRWICPKCRGGCGPGCTNCCNCGPCRKSQGFGPTGQLIQMARRVGFANVHDYLVHLDTQESPEEITLRKKGKRWTRDSGARVHSSILKTHTVKEEVREAVDQEQVAGVKNEVVEEAELYRKSRVRRGEAKVKDEPVHAYVKRRKEKICREPRMESSDRKKFSACDASYSRCKPTNSPVQTSISDNPSEDTWPEKSSEDFVSHRGNSSCVQESDFASLLNATLERPFSMHQMKEMWVHLNFRKPLMKLRQTRSRAIEVPCSVEGLSYLDHYPDLAEKLAEHKSAEEKLRLMRGFFFWLQRSCMEGAYRPWRDAPTVDDSGDCTEICGPDCEIIRVLFAIDEDEENAPLECEDKKPTIRPADVKKFLSPQEPVSRFPVRVKQEKED